MGYFSDQILTYFSKMNEAAFVRVQREDLCRTKSIFEVSQTRECSTLLKTDLKSGQLGAT